MQAMEQTEETSIESHSNMMIDFDKQLTSNEGSESILSD